MNDIALDALRVKVRHEKRLKEEIFLIRAYATIISD